MPRNDALQTGDLLLRERWWARPTLRCLLTEALLSPPGPDRTAIRHLLGVSCQQRVTRRRCATCLQELAPPAHRKFPLLD